jgi:hypothetical protein
VSVLLGPIAGRIPGLELRKPWAGVAESQGWGRKLEEIPARVLVDLWPTLRKLGVVDFPVREDMPPAEVLEKALEHMQKLPKVDHYGGLRLGVKTDEWGRARVVASEPVTDEVDGALYWVDMAAVEALKWTSPAVFEVAVRGCAVLYQRCGLTFPGDDTVDWYLENFVENYEGDEDGEDESRVFHREVAELALHDSEHWEGELGKDGMADLDALLKAAGALGPGWEAWAQGLAGAVRGVGDIWDYREDDESDGEPFHALFQFAVGPRDFIEFIEMVTNDQAMNIGVRNGRISRPLSRWGRRGGLDRLEREAERLRTGFSLLAESIDRLNRLIGAWEGLDDQERPQ